MTNDANWGLFINLYILASPHKYSADIRHGRIIETYARDCKKQLDHLDDECRGTITYMVTYVLKINLCGQTALWSPGSIRALYFANRKADPGLVMGR